MGLYDREYYREEKSGIRLVADFLAEIFTKQAGQHTWLEENLGLQPDFFQHPWTVWQLLTYGFVHDSETPWHVAFNMLGLWVFGAEVETVYGKREFLKLYSS